MKNSIIAADELHQTHDTVTPTFSHLCLKPVIRDGLILETCDYYTTHSFHICVSSQSYVMVSSWKHVIITQLTLFTSVSQASHT